MSEFFKLLVINLRSGSAEPSAGLHRHPLAIDNRHSGDTLSLPLFGLLTLLLGNSTEYFNQNVVDHFQHPCLIFEVNQRGRNVEDTDDHALLLEPFQFSLHFVLIASKAVELLDDDFITFLHNGFQSIVLRTVEAASRDLVAVHILVRNIELLTSYLELPSKVLFLAGHTTKEVFH